MNKEKSITIHLQNKEKFEQVKRDVLSGSDNDFLRILTLKLENVVEVMKETSEEVRKSCLTCK